MKIKKTIAVILSFACLIAFTTPIKSFAAENLSATVIHKHTSNAAPCYTYTKTGSHTEGNYYAHCTNCGDFISSTTSRRFSPYGSCSCGNRSCWDEKCGGEWSVDDYGWKFTCSHTNKNLGTVSISKNKKNLSIVTSEDPNFSITAYAWTGSATGNTANVVATKVGTATCVVTVKDAYSGILSSVTLSVVLDQTDFYSAKLTASKTSWTNEDVTLTCSATGETTSEYKWYKDDKLVKETTTNTYIVSERGDYYCVAVSESGTQAQTSFISIYIDKTPPTLKLTTMRK